MVGGHLAVVAQCRALVAQTGFEFQQLPAFSFSSVFASYHLNSFIFQREARCSKHHFSFETGSSSMSIIYVPKILPKFETMHQQSFSCKIDITVCLIKITFFLY